MKPQQAREKLAQYGLPAMSDNELLTILKFKGTISDYYFSAEFKAAKELVRRYEKPEAKKITSSKDAAEILNFLAHETEENFYCIFLNRANKYSSTFLEYSSAFVFPFSVNVKPSSRLSIKNDTFFCILFTFLN